MSIRGIKRRFYQRHTPWSMAFQRRIAKIRQCIRERTRELKRDMGLIP